MLMLQNLPFDLLINVAFFGGFLNTWKQIFKLSEETIVFIAIRRIQKKWKESKIANLTPGTRVLLQSKKDSSKEECIIVSKVSKYKNDCFKQRIFCVQVTKSYFKFFKYVQFMNDDNYNITLS